MDIRWTEKASSDALVSLITSRTNLSLTQNLSTNGFWSVLFNLQFIPGPDPLCLNLDVTTFANYLYNRFDWSIESRKMKFGY